MRKDRGNKTVATKATTVLPEAVSYDGVTDYLSRSTDLVGNVDSKTFTFSCWVYYMGLSAGYVIYQKGTTDSFRISLSTDGTFILNAKNSAGTTILTINVPLRSLPVQTFSDILISCDMVSTANRYVYIGDRQVSATWTTYTNDTINFTEPLWSIGAIDTGGLPLKGRLSHLFLDYTYRDLSIEANRRLFITADGKPADWNTTKALNGILMLQMKDASTAHINDGYGGGR